MERKIIQQTVLKFINTEIGNMEAINRFGVAKNYACVRNSLSRYLQSRGKTDISFKRLTTERLVNYQAWLWAGGVSKNTSSCYLRSLHALFNKAVRQGFASGNPFTNVYTGIAKTRKRAITVEDIRKLSVLDIEAELIKSGKNPEQKSFATTSQSLHFTRDLFLFCFCACGMTFVDLAHLKKSNISNGFIYYARKKTHQPIEVKVETLMQKIIDKYTQSSPYLFPILTSTDTREADRQYRKAIRIYNMNLKKLSTFLGDGISLTSYVGRHTWATAAYRLHIPLSVICQAMGHDSEHTTQIYLKSLDSAVISDANHKLLDNIFISTSNIEVDKILAQRYKLLIKHAKNGLKK